MDNENSNAGIGFQQYNESFFQYGFLDKKLVSITMLLPRDQNGIDQEFTKYRDAFGPPQDSSIPAQMKANGAMRHAAWSLLDNDLAVTLTVQPSQSVGLVLVGFWRSISKSDELLRRLNGESGAKANASAPPDRTSSFIQTDSFCRDVVHAIPLTDFLKKNPDATLDRGASAANIGFQQYNESCFQYGFLDERLGSITMLLPRDKRGIDHEFAKYQDAFGPADRTDIPTKMRVNGATRHATWFLPAHDLAVSLTAQPSKSVGSTLVGNWRSISKSKELLRRVSGKASGATSHGTRPQTDPDRSEGLAPVDDRLVKQLLREVTARQKIDRSLARLGVGNPVADGLRAILVASQGSTREQVLGQFLGERNRDVLEAFLGRGDAKELSASAAAIEFYRDAPRDSTGRLTDEGLENQERAALTMLGLMNGDAPEPSFRQKRAVSRQLLETSRFAVVNKYIDDAARGKISDSQIETHMRSIEILAVLDGRTPESTLDLLKTGTAGGERRGIDPTLALQASESSLAASVVRKGRQ